MKWASVFAQNDRRGGVSIFKKNLNFKNFGFDVIQNIFCCATGCKWVDSLCLFNVSQFRVQDFYAGIFSMFNTLQNHLFLISICSHSREM